VTSKSASSVSSWWGLLPCVSEQLGEVGFAKKATLLGPLPPRGDAGVLAIARLIAR
jgi:hypothetical protein